MTWAIGALVVAAAVPLSRWFARGVREHGFIGALRFLRELSGEIIVALAKWFVEAVTRPVVVPGIAVRRGRSRRTVSPPGVRLDHAARWFYSTRTYERVLQPALADMQFEYFQALHTGQPRKAKWERLKGYWAFWKAVVAQMPISMLQAVVKLWSSLPG